MTLQQLSLIPSIVDHQTVNVHSKPGTCKLTPEDVKEIRAKVAAGCSQYSQAKRYGLSQSTVSDIIHYRIWHNLR